MTSSSRQLGTLSKSIHSGKWMTLSMVTQKTLSLVTFFILARLLTPADYGVIAAVLIITAVVEHFSNHGLGSALAQKQINIEPYLDAVWTINLFKSFLVAIIIFLLAPFLSYFFKIPEAVAVFRLAGLFIILPSLSNIRQIYFFTKLDFKNIFWRDLTSQLAYSVVAIASVFVISASFWALFLGHLARFITAALITYWLYPSLPYISFNFKQLLPFFKYGKWIAGQDMLNYFASLIDRLLIGRFLPIDMLGFYTKARDLSSLTTSSLTSIIRKVSFFAYNNVQSDLKKIQDGFIKSLDLILIVTLPFAFLLIVEGGAIISVLLGDQWLFLVLPLKVLSVANIFNALVSLVYPIFNSLGRPEINFRIIFFRLLISLPLLYFGIIWQQLVGVAMATGLVSILVLLYVIWESRKILQIGIRNVIPSFLHTSIALTPVVILALSLRPFIHSFNSNIIIFFWVLFLALVYICGIIISGYFVSGGPRETLFVIFKELKNKK